MAPPQAAVGFGLARIGDAGHRLLVVTCCGSRASAERSRDDQREKNLISIDSSLTCFRSIKKGFIAMQDVVVFATTDRWVSRLVSFFFFVGDRDRREDTHRHRRACGERGRAAIARHHRGAAARRARRAANRRAFPAADDRADNSTHHRAAANLRGARIAGRLTVPDDGFRVDQQVRAVGQQAC